MTAFFSTYFCFLLIFTLSPIVSGNERLQNLVQFGSVLNIFSKCQVNLHNYDGISFVLVTDTPLLIHTKVTSRLESDGSIKSNLRLECTAVFHMVAQDSRKNHKKYFDSRKRERKWYETPLMDTKARYDILVGQNKNTITSWMTAYLDVLRLGYSTHGLILNIDKDSFRQTGQILVKDELQIVNKFLVFEIRSKLERLQVNLHQFLHYNGIKALNKAIGDVNDIHRNRHVPWSLNMFRDIPTWITDYKALFIIDHKRTSQSRLIRDLMRNGKSTTLKMMNGPLNPKAIEDEGLDNYLFALTVLGYQVNVSEFDEGPIVLYGEQPSISFNVENAPIILDNEPKRLAFLSCSMNPIGRRIYDKYLDVVTELVSIFDKRIWLMILVSYAIIPLVLGFVYHKMLKKNMKKECWLLWHPFTWGLRSLIRQAGDRILNKQRFGWAMFMVAPLLLMSVVISHSFLGKNLNVLWRRGYWDTRNPLKQLYYGGVKLVTDYMEAADREDGISTMSGEYENKAYEYVSNIVQKNTSIAYISFEERVVAIGNMVKGGYWGKSGMCEKWSPVKMGVIRYYSDHSFSSSLSNAKWNLDHRKYGWEIRNWIDHRILGRINRIKGESQIVSRWKELIKWQVDKIGRKEKYGNFLMRPNMFTNIVYVFQWLMQNLGLALLVWGFEWLVWEIHTKPNRKRKKLLEEKLKEVKEEDKCIDIENDECENGMQDDLVNEALDLVEETRKRSAGDGNKPAEGKQKKRGLKIVEELGEDEDHLANIIEQREDCSDMSDLDMMNEMEIEADVLNHDIESLVSLEEDGEILAEYGRDGEDSNIDEELDTLEVGSGFNSDADEEDNHRNDGLNLGSAVERRKNIEVSCIEGLESGKDNVSMQVDDTKIDI